MKLLLKARVTTSPTSVTFSLIFSAASASPTDTMPAHGRSDDSYTLWEEADNSLIIIGPRQLAPRQLESVC